MKAFSPRPRQFAFLIFSAVSVTLTAHSLAADTFKETDFTQAEFY
jgi:hypothetical protein